MAKRRSHSRVRYLSPINPSIHFILFLILALFLVIIVAGIMQRTGQSIRASLICPKLNLTEKVSEVKLGCPDQKVTVTLDANRCPVVTCTTTQ